MNRIGSVACVAIVAFSMASGGCGMFRKKDQNVQAPPPPDASAYGPQPQPFEPVQVQPSGPQPMPMDPYATSAPSGGFAGGNTYTVQKGDTIFGISRKVYGSNARARDIINANPGINPDRITVGQTINLPE